MKFTCEKCPLKAACKAPCAAVESMLPCEDKGKIHRLRRRNSYAKAGALLESIDDTRFLVANRHRLQGRLRQVFDLVYNEGMGHAEIAKLLGLHRRSVGHLVKQARRVIVRLAKRGLSP
jgi:DNA-directed RNA polymerase specialized sigma24 family protein